MHFVSRYAVDVSKTTVEPTKNAVLCPNMEPNKPANSRFPPNQGERNTLIIHKHQKKKNKSHFLRKPAPYNASLVVKAVNDLTASSYIVVNTQGLKSIHSFIQVKKPLCNRGF